MAYSVLYFFHVICTYSEIMNKINFIFKLICV